MTTPEGLERAIVNLGALGEFRNGVNFSRAKKGKGVRLINVKDIFTDSPMIDFESLDRVDLSDLTAIESYFVKRGDIFFVRSSVKRDGIGQVSMAGRDDEETVHCGFIIRYRLTSPKTDPLFLTYMLRSPPLRRQIVAISGGSAITNLTQASLTSLQVSLPSTETQRKVACILSMYDDLVANNRCRIQILEEMVRAIYREWFVHFRFPGHEEVEMAGSEIGEIPEGWSFLTLGEVLSTLESGSRPKGGIDSHERGVQSIGAENILGLGQYDYSKEKYVSRVFYDKMSRGRIRSGDVLLYKDGASLGRKSMFRDGFPHEQCCINEHVFILRSNDYVSQNYLYFWLDRPDMTQRIVNLNANAAQPGINQSSIRGLPILVPQPSLISKFEDMVDPMIALLFNLAKQIKSLSEARDLLLSKLVSGEIDVSHLDIEATLPNTQQTSKYKEQSTLDQWTDGDDQDADIG